MASMEGDQVGAAHRHAQMSHLNLTWQSWNCRLGSFRAMMSEFSLHRGQLRHGGVFSRHWHFLRCNLRHAMQESSVGRFCACESQVPTSAPRVLRSLCSDATLLSCQCCVCLFSLSSKHGGRVASVRYRHNSGTLSIHQLVEMPGKVRGGTWHAVWKAFATTALMCSSSLQGTGQAASHRQSDTRATAPHLFPSMSVLVDRPSLTV